MYCSSFFFNDPATTEIYTLSLHDALPIWRGRARTVAGDLHDHRLIRGRAVPMRRPCRVHHEAARRQRHCLLHVEDSAGAGMPCPLEYRHVARIGMPMWPIHHMGWKFRPDDVQPRLVRVTQERSNLRAVSVRHVRPMHLIGRDPEELGVAGRRCRPASDEEKAGRSEVMRELHDQDPPQTAGSRADQKGEHAPTKLTSLTLMKGALKAGCSGCARTATGAAMPGGVTSFQAPGGNREVGHASDSTSVSCSCTDWRVTPAAP